jgi:hypothetical protein
VPHVHPLSFLLNQQKLKPMKKIVFILSLVCFAALSVSAQRTQKFYSSYGFASDTLTDATTVYLGVNVSNVTGSSTTIITTVDELSGTTAGTVTLQGSHDGTTFVALTDTTYVPRILTFTLADQAAAQSKVWILNGSPFPHYRLSHSGGTTMSATFTGTIYINKQED